LFEHTEPNPKINPDAVFQVAVDITLGHEGGYVDNPNDPGGETHFGISKRSYPHLDIKIVDKPKARKIYKVDFWKKPKLDLLAEIAPDLAIKTFDLGVNVGPQTAIKFLQRAINTVCCGEFMPRRAAAWKQNIADMVDGKILKVDGIIGPITLSVIKECPHENALMAALKGEAYKHYSRGISSYIPGWLNRLES